jgi:hypothetical protein
MMARVIYRIFDMIRDTVLELDESCASYRAGVRPFLDVEKLLKPPFKACIAAIPNVGLNADGFSR